MEKTTWSHSRLNTLMNNPAEYYLSYVEGIKPVTTKSALSLGSAVHYGLEIGDSDLTEYYKENGSFNQRDAYSDEQCLAESMVSSFLSRKEEIYNDILKDLETGEKLDIIDEQHELSLTAHLNSKYFPEGHDFIGIIDLLFLTNKGWILVDYKTSSRAVEWEQYKSQLFKYKHLLSVNFPDAPLYKVCIINLQKANLRRKKEENNDSFRKRLCDQYLIDEGLINYHIYEGYEFDDDALSNYVNDLCGLIDTARTITDRNCYYTNYSNVVGLYGPSQYADIFYNVPDAYTEYKIKDTIYDENEDMVINERPCVELDMKVLKYKNIMNKYDKFKKEVYNIYKIKDPKLLLTFTTKEDLFKKMNERFLCDQKLLEKYFITFLKNL